MGKEEELEEIYEVYESLIEKEGGGMEEEEGDDWEGKMMLGVGVEYGSWNVCGNMKKWEV